MRRLSSRLVLLALALAVAAFAAGCGGGGKKSKEGVSVTAGKNLTFAVITHGEGDTFWAVAKKGAIQAGKDEGVTVKYSESQNDPQKQAQLISAAVTQKVDGIATSAKLATFDLSGNVIKAIQAGKIQFAIDQQQYLQGYLPVVFLTLYKTNNNTIGGGQPVLTGPGFVDKSNAGTVAKLTTEGTR